MLKKIDNLYPKDFRNGKPYGSARIYDDACESQLASCEKDLVEAIQDYGQGKISKERLAEILGINFYDLDMAFKRGMPEGWKSPQEVEALQAEIASLKNDVNTLNDIVRWRTDMGQGEIDSLAVDIEAIKREAYSNGLTDGRREAVKFIGDGCEWDKKLKEWGLEGK